MSALKKAGSAQTRKTYARHGAAEPMFGVSFATLKILYKRIGVDQELAQALWRTGNFDAYNLAYKIADPAKISSRELDRWAATPTARMCCGYVAHLAAESPHGRAKADQWLAASDDTTRSAGWNLVAALAMVDESIADSWFAQQLGRIEVDHGDTSCKTPVAAESIEKNWQRAKSRGFESPAAHERSRESMRTRC